jgi:hypothetical protein
MSVDYTAIAIITVFTSFCAGFGSELAKTVIHYIKKLRALKKLREPKSF